MIGASPLRRLGVVSVCITALFLAGCGGGKGVKIKGKIILPAGVKLEEKDSLQVNFVSAGDKPQSAAAKVNYSDLSFTVSGGDNKGVAPGKYKVMVSCAPYAGEAKAEDRKILLAKQFAAFGEKTPLEIDLSDGADQTITIDLDKKMVSK
jgi:hypothetical protein